MGRTLLLARHTHYRLDAFICAVQVLKMDSLSNFVSLHPYFKVHPGKLDAFKAALPAFIEKTVTEEKNLFYGFSINGDEIFAGKATKTPKACLGISRTLARCLRKRSNI
jgi:hypothetical protein